MLNLKKLTFSNIGRFIEEQAIDFANLGQLVQVDAQNLNTGGSSGSGKSTIFNALDFILGLSDLPISTLQSRLTKNHISGTAVFDWDGREVFITRARKLSVTIDGVETTGSSKLSEEKLDEVLGMPRNLFRVLLHKRQGEQGFFLQMTPSKMNDFLVDTLDLSIIRSKVDLIDFKAKDISDAMVTTVSSLNALKSALEATGHAISSLGEEPITNVTESILEALKTQYEAVRNIRILVERNHKTELEDLEKVRPQVTTVPFNRDQIEDLETEIGTFLANISNLEKNEIKRQSDVKTKISELQEKINALNTTEQIRQREVEHSISDIKFNKSHALLPVSQGQRAKEEAKILAEELNKICLSMCPTCEREWVTDSAKAKEIEILQKLQLCKKTILAGIEASERVKFYEEEISRLSLEVQPRAIPETEELNKEISRLKVESQPKKGPEIEMLMASIEPKNVILDGLRQQERQHQFIENAKIKDALSVFAQNQEELRKKHQLTTQKLQSEENLGYADFQRADNELKNFKESKRRFEESYNKLRNQESEYKEQIVVKSFELSYLQEQLDLFAESKRAIKSYLSCSFDDALDSISEMATKILRSVPTMANATIRLESLKETGAGAIKEQINAVLDNDGELEIPIKSLSGGERSAVDLAMDLAVANLIQEKANKGIDLMILDEPFGGFDSIGVEQALEMLKNLDKRILIVEHNPVAKEFIQDRITVFREGETSYIK